MRLAHNGANVHMALVGMLALALSNSVCLGYNLDVHNPIEYRGGLVDGSEFGFSVALHSPSDSGRALVIIGAPNDELAQPGIGVTRPGVVYKCAPEFGGNCTQLNVDGGENDVLNGWWVGNDYVIFREEKSYMRLGETIQSAGPGNSLVACAPMFHETYPSAIQYINGNKTHWDPIGRCYVLKRGQLQVPNVVSKEILEPCQSLMRAKWQPYRYGYIKHSSTCAVGKSLDVMEGPGEDSTSVLMGAPFSWYSLGRIMHTDLNHSSTARDYVATPRPTAFANPLVGFAVAHGKLTADESQSAVFSMPMYKSGIGAVYVSPLDGPGSLLEKLVITESPNEWPSSDGQLSRAFIIGQQFGELFGYSLCAQDVDGDGIEELFVGAPMYTKPNSDDMVNGRVYIYSTSLVQVLSESDRNDSFMIGKADSYRTGASNSQFGLSIASLGDIDGDGFNDLAIGAPFEKTLGGDEGAVYIFLGSPSGLLDESAQRIYPSMPEMAFVNMKGFGFSISRGANADGIGYNDLLVGAPLSNRAVLLRSRPIIDVRMSFRPRNYYEMDLLHDKCPHHNDIKRPCVRIRLCGQANLDSNNGGQVAIHFNMKTSPDMLIVPAHAPKTQPLSTLTNLTMMLNETDRHVCVPYIVFAMVGLKDPCSERPLTVSWTMIEELPTPLRVTPKMRPARPETAHISLLSSHRSSEPDLAVRGVVFDSSLTEVNSIVNGLSDSGQLSFLLHNNGLQHACKVTVMVNLPKGIAFKEDMVPGNSCLPLAANKSHVRCELSSYMVHGRQEEFVLDLNVHVKASGPEIESMAIIVRAVSSNEESAATRGDNEAKLPLSLLTRSSVLVFAQSEYTSRYLTNGSNPAPGLHFDDVGPDFSHTLQTYNEGPSPSPPVRITISWPSRTSRGVELLYLTTVEHNHHDSLDVACNASSVINPHDYTGSLRNQTDYFRPVISMASMSKNLEMCSEHFCRTIISCQIPSLPAEEATGIRLRWRAWTKPILNAALVPFTAKSVVTISGFDEWPNSDFEWTNRRSFLPATAATVLTGKVSKKTSLELWKIIVPIAAGVLLLLLLLLVLYKVGFFKRQHQYEAVRTNSNTVDGPSRRKSTSSRRKFSEV